jgi:hypothetical protein
LARGGGGGRGGEGDYSEREEALYFFKYRFLNIGKWSLSCFKEKTSGIEQTGEMMVPENTLDTL